MKVNNVSNSFVYSNCSPTRFNQRAQKLGALVGVIALGILIVPLFIPKYRKWFIHVYYSYRAVDKKIQSASVRGFASQKFNFKSPLSKLGPFPILDESVLTNGVSRELLTNEAHTRYDKLLKEFPEGHIAKKMPFMGKVDYIPGEFSLWMPGVSLVAGYLTQKRNLQGFYVCGTLQAFSKKLNAFIKSPKDERAAFIISAVRPSPFTRPDFPQHKIAVAVEKKGKKLKIVLLDGEGNKINSNNLGCKNIWDGYKVPGNFNYSEVVLRAILQAELPEHAELFYFPFEREVIYGCETFALGDAAAFLEDTDFFNKIKIEEHGQKIPNGLILKRIIEVPAAFMVPAQHAADVQKYINEHPHAIQIPGRKKNLAQYQAKHIIQVGKRKQNHFVTKKMFKYQEIVIQILEKLSSSEIEQLMRSIYINE